MKSIYALALLGCGLWPAMASADVTGVTGGSAPQSTIQPSLGVNYIIRTTGIYGGGVGGMGEVSMFAGNFAPDGYALCNGQLLSISQNDALFSLLGTTYGGDGQSTFALPNLQGRTVIGTGSGAGLTPRTLGDTVGTQAVTLTTNNLPADSHTLPAPGTVTGVTGSGQAYTNMQPSMALNYLVALQGIYPSQGGGGGTATEPLLGQIVINASNYLPNGYALAQGQVMAISQNTALFSILGTTYGGNGTNNFALPDLSGRAPLGVGQTHVLGESTGVESLTLTESQLPAHTHTVAGLSGPTTGVDGGGLSQDNMQPALALHYMISLYGIYPSRGGGGGSLEEPMVGQIDLFAGNFAPSGWAFCDGQLMPISQNTALFSLLGTTYGGNGQSTFALPNLDGSLAVDAGQGPGLDPWDLGQFEGTETNTLTVAQMAAHTHTYSVVAVPDATTPEPGTLSLLGLAALPLLLKRRGRRAA